MKGYPASMERHTTHIYDATCNGCTLVARGLTTPVPPSGWATLVLSRETRGVLPGEWVENRSDEPCVIFQPCIGVKFNYCPECLKTLEVQG